MMMSAGPRLPSGSVKLSNTSKLSAVRSWAMSTPHSTIRSTARLSDSTASAASKSSGSTKAEPRNLRQLVGSLQGSDRTGREGFKDHAHDSLLALVTSWRHGHRPGE